MQSSESTTNINKALLAAQKEFEPVKKTVTNTFFKSKYATLDAVLSACLPILNKHDLIVLQPIETLENGDTVLETQIIHISGEWIGSKVKIPEMQQKGANLLQEFGIGVTYLRRYELSSLLGISTEEDNDGNRPSQQKETKREKNATIHQVAQIKQLFIDLFDDIKDDEHLEEKINKRLKAKNNNDLDTLGFGEASAIIQKLEAFKGSKDNAE